ncbi:MAG: chromosomal replication initiator protein [Chloroflexia bacterium]|jgi:chromosomal replication initiator protein|nr:chromosomal replication initiator protein [Chloroflexia bacterium]
MNAKQVWQAALGELQVKVPGPSFQTWLKNTSIADFQDNVVVIAVPSNFAKEWLEKRFSKLIAETLHNVLNHKVEVQFEVKTPARGTSAAGRALHALDGVGIDKEARELPMVVGGNNPNPYANKVTNGHGPNANPNQNSNAPKQLHAAPSGPQTVNPAQVGYGTAGNNITNLTRSNNNAASIPSGSNNSDRSYNSPVTPMKRSGAVQFEMSLEEATMLNPRYLFDSFIVGKSNQLAYAAARAVAEKPAMSYNPLFLYGGVGLGKTHLLHAIGHDAMRRYPGIKVLYVTSEKFTNDLINAIRDQRNENFRNMYRSADILLIDDVQFIAGKESTQEEFFHTFNALHGANKQIVLTSDRPPKAILTLEERLRSRFEWGLIADIQPPDLETRIAILRAKAETMPVGVPTEVLDYIARKVQSNIRELEGALNRIVAYAQLNNTAVSVDLAAASLNELGANQRRRPINHERIVETVSSFFNLEPEDLKTGSRSREVLVPRQIAMYLMREETETPFIQIAAYFGKRDHTTAMHSYEKIEGLIETDNQMRQDVLTVRQMLYGEHER